MPDRLTTDTAPARTRKAGAGLFAHNPLSEIFVAPRARAAEPTIVERDDAEVVRRDKTKPFIGTIYFVWMPHDPDGGCDRDPTTDPHEDLAYVGKTSRPFYVRQREHLAAKKPGTDQPNNSAVFRNASRVPAGRIGWSTDPRTYDTPEKLAAAELRAIKTLWPAWNIQDQDRRNPASRASRSYRRPDRLAPLIGLASALWAIVWAAAVAVQLIAWAMLAEIVHWMPMELVGVETLPWWTAILVPIMSFVQVGAAQARHRRSLAARERAKWKAEKHR
jgi:hypothetical protein